MSLMKLSRALLDDIANKAAEYSPRKNVGGWIGSCKLLTRVARPLVYKEIGYVVRKRAPPLQRLDRFFGSTAFKEACAHVQHLHIFAGAISPMGGKFAHIAIPIADIAQSCKNFPRLLKVTIEGVDVVGWGIHDQPSPVTSVRTLQFRDVVVGEEGLGVVFALKWLPNLDTLILDVVPRPFFQILLPDQSSIHSLYVSCSPLDAGIAEPVSYACRRTLTDLEIAITRSCHHDVSEWEASLPQLNQLHQLEALTVRITISEDLTELEDMRDLQRQCQWILSRAEMVGVVQQKVRIVLDDYSPYRSGIVWTAINPAITIIFDQTTAHALAQPDCSVIFELQQPEDFPQDDPWAEGCERLIRESEGEIPPNLEIRIVRMADEYAKFRIARPSGPFSADDWDEDEGFRSFSE